MFCWSERRKKSTSTSKLPPIKGWFSHWSDPKSYLSNYRSSSNLPSFADVVIIGSGFSGTSVAYHLIDQGLSNDVVILEAREACSGASGRNGGHLAPEYVPMFKIADEDDFSSTTTAIADEAEYVRVSNFEKDNFDAVYKLIKELSISCDVIEDAPRGLFAVQSKDDAKLLRSRYDLLTKAGVDLSDLEIYDSAEDVYANTGLKGINFAIASKTTPINPYKLVTGMLEHLIDGSKDIQLYTNTAVEKISHHLSGYLVSTSDGRILANKVVLATNGYSGKFLSTSHLVYPVRGQISRWILEPSALKHLPLVENKISIGMDIGYLSVIPEYAADTVAGQEEKKPLKLSVTLGGAREYSPTKELDIIDDGKVNPIISRKINEMAESVFGITEAPVEEWTGIMGFSEIDQPLVGQIQVNDGNTQVLGMVGFQGHGMPRIFLSAKALVHKFFGDNGEQENWPHWFPHSYPA